MDVIVVESPAKAGTINKYLGSNAKVLASFGHIRDLPNVNGSVDPANNFAMKWEVSPKSSKHIKEISEAMKSADRLVLATDPDREGEAISWHVYEILQKKGLLEGKEICRVAFNAITKTAVLEAMKHPREIDKKLVDAYLARRALDYLVGFTLSPVLWRKLPGSRSAGRVQSVALRLICEREFEIERFQSQEYWSVKTNFSSPDNKDFIASLTHLDGEKLDKFSLTNSEDANRAKNNIEAGSFSVTKVEQKPEKRRPKAPYTTSTLQQDASTRLGFSASVTMQIAQRLYEAGHITYMRTDSVQIIPEAIETIRQAIENNLSKEYIPAKPNFYKSKAKNAQEAHEAIRPTHPEKSKEEMKALLDTDQFRLFELIWNRTLASQMENAQIERTIAEISSQDGKTKLRASGSVITFPGYLKLYEDRVNKNKQEEDKILPALQENQALQIKEVLPEEHHTEPPPRYGEASLVKRMEELGIGRPSTYASILSVLPKRGYVNLEKKRFHPSDKGRLVTSFLENFFTRYVEYDFTAELEEKLDKISNGTINWQDLLNDFWKKFESNVNEAMEIRTTEILDRLNEVLAPYIFPDKGEGDPRQCPKCKEGELSLKTSRYGAFIGCTLYPDCNFTRPFADNGDQADIEREIGKDLESGKIIFLKTGRFGPYLQLGEVEEGEKPKRVSIPKGMSPTEIDFDTAAKLISLPRIIGTHPETGKEIIASIGPYGPYLKHETLYANLDDPMELFDIGVNRAVTLLAEKKSKGRGAGNATIKELGEHPENKKPIRVMNGRFGPYVKNASINATIPKDENPEQITIERAIELIAARAAKGPRKKKKASKKTKAKNK